MLKQQLIKSLEALREHAADPKRIKCVITSIKGVTIPEDDYIKILKLLIHLTKEMPDLLQNPNDGPLKELAHHCLNQINLLSELNNKQSFHRSK